MLKQITVCHLQVRIRCETGETFPNTLLQNKLSLFKINVISLSFSCQTACPDTTLLVTGVNMLWCQSSQKWMYILLHTYFDTNEIVKMKLLLKEIMVAYRPRKRREKPTHVFFFCFCFFFFSKIVLVFALHIRDRDARQRSKSHWNEITPSEKQQQNTCRHTKQNKTLQQQNVTYVTCKSCVKMWSFCCTSMGSKLRPIPVSITQETLHLKDMISIVYFASFLFLRRKKRACFKKYMYWSMFFILIFFPTVFHIFFPTVFPLPPPPTTTPPPHPPKNTQPT